MQMTNKMLEDLLSSFPEDIQNAIRENPKVMDTLKKGLKYDDLEIESARKSLELESERSAAKDLISAWYKCGEIGLDAIDIYERKKRPTITKEDEQYDNILKSIPGDSLSKA